MRFILFSIFLLVIRLASVNAQVLSWNAGYDGFLDNREYFSIDNPQTIFGSRVWGEIGGDIGDDYQGMHRFRAGINYLYEMGSIPDSFRPDITMYYHYDNERFNFHIGAFPRRDLLDYPLAFLSDTLNYYRPNIQGAYLGYNWYFGKQHVFIDWTSRQTDERYERFIFGTAGRLHFGIVFIENYLMMAHLAGKSIPEPDFHLRDNGGFNLNFGVDLSNHIFLDTLLLKAGGLVSLDRIRGIDPGWQTPSGIIGQLDARYRIFGISALYYAGQGHTFFYGDPFYRLNRYGRLDIYLKPFRRSFVDLKVNFILHFAEGQVDYSQQLILIFKI